MIGELPDSRQLVRIANFFLAGSEKKYRLRHTDTVDFHQVPRLKNYIFSQIGLDKLGKFAYFILVMYLAFATFKTCTGYRRQIPRRWP